MRIRDVIFRATCLFALVAIAPALIANGAEKAKQPIPIVPLNRTTPVDFQDEILPIFRTSCLACHNRTTTKSGLILETPQTILKGSEDGPVVVPGKSAESQMLTLAAHQDKPVMPPRDNKASAPNLTGDQLALIKLWIDQGAKGEVRSTAIHWQSIAKTFTPAYAVAITDDAQFAAVGRANQLDLYQLPFQRALPPLIDPTLAKIGPIAHRDMVYSLAFSPDGQRLASGSFGEIKIWRRLATTANIMFTSGTAGVVAASPNGKWLAIAGERNEIRIVDAVTGKLSKSLAGDAPAHLLRFALDSTKLASVSSKTLRVWNMADDKPSSEMRVPAEIRAIAWTNAGKQLAAGYADNIIRLYKISEGSPLTLSAGAEIKGHTAAVTSLDSITPGNQVLSGSVDGTVRVWNLDNGQQIRQMVQGGPVTSVTVRSDGKLFASGDENGVAKIWDAAKGSLIADVKGDRELNLIAAEKDDAQKLAAADTAYFKTVLTKALADLKAQEDRMKKAADAKLAADKPVPEKEAALKTATEGKAHADKALATATADQKRWADASTAAEQAQKDAEAAFAKVKNEKPSPEIEALKAKLAAATKAAADAKAALAKAVATVKQATDGASNAAKAVASADDALKVAQRVQANAANEGMLASAAVTRANAAIAAEQSTINAAEQREKQAVIDAASAKQSATAAQKPLRAVSFSPDGSTLASTGDDRKIHLWAAETGAPLQTIDAHTSSIVSLSFGSNSALLSASTDGAANLWNIAPAWTLERTIGSGDANSTLSDRVNALTFSPDGQTLASGSGEPSRGGEIKLWEISTGNLLHDFKDIHSDAVLCLDFSRDGKRLASGAADRFVKITDIATGKVIQSLEGHTHHVLAVSFKADGRTLASTGADGQVKMWDLVAGERKAAVPGSATEVTSIHFMGISDQAILTAADGQVRVITATGGAVRSFANPADHIHSAANSSDGRTLLCSGQSGALYLWDAAAGKLLATFAPVKD